MALHEPTFGPLPATAQGCRERLADLHAEIASIKTQIATVDIERQTRRGTLDAQQFHRARSALRFRQQDAARVAAQLTRLIGESPREGFKDTLIDVLREHFSDEAWQSALGIARARQGREVGHG